MRIIIIRHGDPDYEHDSLTPRGDTEAKLLADIIDRYNIDHFYVSRALKSEVEAAREQTKAVQVPFLMAEDRTHGGLKPLRTYSGPRYTAGVSDHLPILLRLP